jgi:hypothetical protein
MPVLTGRENMSPLRIVLTQTKKSIRTPASPSQISLVVFSLKLEDEEEEKAFFAANLQH